MDDRWIDGWIYFKDKEMDYIYILDESSERIEELKKWKIEW